MFTELEPLLADRTLVLTLSAAPGGLIRANVIPKCLKEDDAAEKALATPLSVTGTAADLDREFPGQIASYAQSICETGSTLNRIREAHKAAVKEVEAENKKALDAKRKLTGSCKPATKSDDKMESKDEEKAPEEKPAAPIVSLFDDPPENAPSTNNPATGEAPNPAN